MTKYCEIILSSSGQHGGWDVEAIEPIEDEKGLEFEDREFVISVDQVERIERILAE